MVVYSDCLRSWIVFCVLDCNIFGWIMIRTIKVTASVKVPMVPNFLQMEDGQTIPLRAITEDGLRELGKLWTEALVERAKEQAMTRGE